VARSIFVGSIPNEEVVPKGSANLRYTLIGALTFKVSSLWTISEARVLKRLSTGYRHVGEGPGGGVPLPIKVFWDNFKAISLWYKSHLYKQRGHPNTLAIMTLHAR
jgi:hypothetical protein